MNDIISKAILLKESKWWNQSHLRDEEQPPHVMMRIEDMSIHLQSCMSGKYLIHAGLRNRIGSENNKILRRVK